MTTVFLVGATGGLGMHVLRGLLARDAVRVVAYVRTPSKLDAFRCPQLHVIQGDFTSLNAEALSEIDVIVATHSSSTFERYLGYEALVKHAITADVTRLVGVGGAGQLRMVNGDIKQSDPAWFPGLQAVTEDHERGLATLKASRLQWTWVAPPYMPTDAVSSGGYVVTRDAWNDTGMLPQVDVARFIVDETLAPQHIGHVVGLSAPQVED